MAVRLGVLDVGSNSAQLQLVEVYPGAPPLPAHALPAHSVPTHAVKESTRLGEEFESSRSINDGGGDRVAAVVARAMVAAQRLSVEQLFAFTTSAVRGVTKRDLILVRIEEVAGIRLQFSSGEDDAWITYLAAHRLPSTRGDRMSELLAWRVEPWSGR